MPTRQPDSMYLHSNFSLPTDEPREYASPVSISGFRVDTNNEIGCTTMLDPIREQVDLKDTAMLHNADKKQKAALQLFGSEQQMSVLQELSNLLYARGRLQELGCTFTQIGELTTYGHPASLEEWDNMLLLGPTYDEQWTLFFMPSQTSRIDQDVDMWPDLRTLRKVLINENVAFGFRHRRLTRGDGTEKLIRLCAVYDDLHKLWSPMTTHVPTPVNDWGRHGLDGFFEDSACFVSDDHDQMDHKSELTHMESSSVQLGTKSQSSPPRNLGWRFSDDIDEATAARYADFTDDDRYADIEADLEVAMAAPYPVVDDQVLRCQSPVQSHRSNDLVSLPTLSSLFQRTNLSKLWHSPSPRQVSCVTFQASPLEQAIRTQDINTPIISFRNKQMNNTLNDDVNPDANINTTTNPRSNTDGDLKTKPTKNKTLRGWWRGVFGKNQKTAPRPSVDLMGGWW
jgi:hypothetical protein